MYTNNILGSEEFGFNLITENVGLKLNNIILKAVKKHAVGICDLAKAFEMLLDK
jgi:hypothetical protein